MARGEGLYTPLTKAETSGHEEQENLIFGEEHIVVDANFEKRERGRQDMVQSKFTFRK